MLGLHTERDRNQTYTNNSTKLEGDWYTKDNTLATTDGIYPAPVSGGFGRRNWTMPQILHVSVYLLPLFLICYHFFNVFCTEKR